MVFCDRIFFAQRSYSKSLPRITSPFAEECRRSQKRSDTFYCTSRSAVCLQDSPGRLSEQNVCAHWKCFILVCCDHCFVNEAGVACSEPLAATQSAMDSNGNSAGNKISADLAIRKLVMSLWPLGCTPWRLREPPLKVFSSCNPCRLTDAAALSVLRCKCSGAVIACLYSYTSWLLPYP